MKTNKVCFHLIYIVTHMQFYFVHRGIITFIIIWIDVKNEIIIDKYVLQLTFH